MFGLSSDDVLLIASVVVPAVYQLASPLVSALEAKLPENQRALVSSLVTSAVKAIEQTTSGSDMSGEDKRAQAIQLIQRLASQSGVNFSKNELLINTLLEEAVQGLNAAQQVLPVVASAPKPAAPSPFAGLHPDGSK